MPSNRTPDEDATMEETLKRRREPDIKFPYKLDVIRHRGAGELDIYALERVYLNRQPPLHETPNDNEGRRRWRSHISVGCGL